MTQTANTAKDHQENNGMLQIGQVNHQTLTLSMKGKNPKNNQQFKETAV